MTQLIKHYWVDRDRPGVFATTPAQFAQPMFGVVGFTAEGIVGVHSLIDENGIEFFLSNVPDETVITEVNPGLSILTQQEWDDEIDAYDSRQSIKRQSSVRKYRNQLLDETDWVVIRSTETGVALSQEFTDWRQELRDLPTVQPFPTEIPAAPADVSVNESVYANFVGELRGIHMINDPLPPLEQSQP
jgi:hypothetical protein